MKVNNRDNVKTFLANGRVENDEITVRGLERLLPNIAKHRKRNKLNSINALLDEQDLQEMEGIWSPERLAQIYQAYSIHCLLTAQNQAREDELIAAALTANDRLYWMTSGVNFQSYSNAILKKTTDHNIHKQPAVVQSRSKKVVTMAARLA